MRKMMTGFAFAAALALCGGSAFAADQLITGKKLLITNPGGVSGANNKIVYLSKDTDIALPASVAQDPRCSPDGANVDSVLIVSSAASGESASINLPCANWTVNGAGNLYKYKDTTGATCKIVLIKAGKLEKAVCKGTQVSYDLSADQVSVDVKLRTGTALQYCATFNAAPAGCSVVKNGSDEKKYLAKNCTADALACPASPSGAFVEVAGLF
jgi:hypothetical protein